METGGPAGGACLAPSQIKIQQSAVWLKRNITL